MQLSYIKYILEDRVHLIGRVSRVNLLTCICCMADANAQRLRSSEVEMGA